MHTRVLASDTLNINLSDGVPVLKVSLIVVSGTCTVNGNYAYQGVDSEAISLSSGSTDTLIATSASAPLDGITITAVGGTTNVELFF